MTPTNTAPSPRSTVKRAAERAHYELDQIKAIVDDAWVCHVAFAAPDIICIPTACWRIDEHLYIHGSNGSRMMKHLASGAQACVTLTLLDGLVLARSAFSHSMNYRSVVIHGAFELVDATSKPAALTAFMARIAPERATDARPSDDNELAATTVLKIPLHEAAAKIRNWGPKDKEEDLARPTWAGVIPLATRALAPQPDTANTQPLPHYLVDWSPLTAE